MLRKNGAVCLTLSAIATFLFSGPIAAQDNLKATRSPIGTPVEVTAGQEFYAETLLEEVPAYRLEKPFKSSMGGAMGLPFGFAIDSTLLVSFRKTENWEYFIPADGKFRAYHGLLGSVIAEGDTVGLRVNKSGKMEWFVDNSNKNGYTTIWSRKVKEKDPLVEPTTTHIQRPTGESIERLVYLGFAGERLVRIRHERITAHEVLRDEFNFPVSENGIGMGAVRGAEFSIIATPVRATITVTKGMSSDIGESLVKQ